MSRSVRRFLCVQGRGRSGQIGRCIRYQSGTTARAHNRARRSGEPSTTEAAFTRERQRRPTPRRVLLWMKSGGPSCLRCVLWKRLAGSRDVHDPEACRRRTLKSCGRDRVINGRDLTRAFSVWRSDAEIDWSRSRDGEGVYRGHAELERFWGEFWSTFGTVEVKTHGFIQAGADVVIPNSAHLRGREGIEVVARSTFVYTVKRGQITRLRMFQELGHALEAVGFPSSHNYRCGRKAALRMECGRRSRPYSLAQSGDAGECHGPNSVVASGCSNRTWRRASGLSSSANRSSNTLLPPASCISPLASRQRPAMKVLALKSGLSYPWRSPCPVSRSATETLTPLPDLLTATAGPPLGRGAELEDPSPINRPRAALLQFLINQPWIAGDS